MTDRRCKFKRPDGCNCGSFQFNLHGQDIDQGDLCDVHYWQAKAEVAQADTARLDFVIDNALVIHMRHPLSIATIDRAGIDAAMIEAKGTA